MTVLPADPGRGRRPAPGRNDAIRSEKFPVVPPPRSLGEEPAELEKIGLEAIDRGGGSVEALVSSHRLEIDRALPHPRRPEVGGSSRTGFWPCAWCRQVRSDGDYWEQVESYVAKRSGLQFSHAICPACRRRELEECRESTSG